MRKHPPDIMGLKRAGTVFASTRTPLDTLFSYPGIRAFYPFSFANMISEMGAVFPGMWKNKSVIFDTTLDTHMNKGCHDGVDSLTETLEQERSSLTTTDAEGIFLDEVVRIAKARSDISQAGRDAVSSISIAIAPTPGTPAQVVEQMERAIRVHANTMDHDFGVDVLGEGIKLGDGVNDVVIVVGGQPRDVYGQVVSSLEDGKIDQGTLLPVVCGAIDAHRFAKLGVPTFDVAHAIVESMSRQSSTGTVYST